MDDLGTSPSVLPPRHPAGFYLVIAVFFSLLLGTNSYLAWQHNQETLGASTEKLPPKTVVTLPIPSPTWPAGYPLCFRKVPTPTIPYLSLKVEPTLAELMSKCPVFMLKKYKAIPVDSIGLFADKFTLQQAGLLETIYEQKPVYDFAAVPSSRVFTKTAETQTQTTISIDGVSTKGTVLSIRSCTLKNDAYCKETEKGLLVLLPNGTWLQVTGDYIHTILTKNFPVDFPIEITYLKP